jgi:hypothetical protein
MEAVDLLALKKSQWESCYQAELGCAEQRLVAAERDRLVNYPESGPRLREAFKHWREFRSTYCDLTAAGKGNPNPGEARLACQAELTLQQAIMLENGI